MPSNRLVGVLGGTFNPIHFGHLRIAEEFAAQLRLEQIRFVPVGQPSHRAVPTVSALHRLEMVKLAISGNPLFIADDRECQQAAPSYTVDTLIALRNELGDAGALCLLMGADAFVALTTWKRWDELFELAHIVVAHRPGLDRNTAFQQMPPILQDTFRARLAHDASLIYQKPAGCVLPVDTTALDISASAIRQLISNNKSPRYLLPDAVFNYIRHHHLYRTLNEG